MTVLSWCKGCDERVSSAVDPRAFKDRINGQIYCARCREEVTACVAGAAPTYAVPCLLTAALLVLIIAIGSWAAGWI